MFECIECVFAYELSVRLLPWHLFGALRRGYVTVSIDAVSICLTNAVTI